MLVLNQIGFYKVHGLPNSTRKEKKKKKKKIVYNKINNTPNLQSSLIDGEVRLWVKWEWRFMIKDREWEREDRHWRVWGMLILYPQGQGTTFWFDPSLFLLLSEFLFLALYLYVVVWPEKYKNKRNKMVSFSFQLWMAKIHLKPSIKSNNLWHDNTTRCQL